MGDSPNPKQWKHDCNELLNIISQREDSQPFREPVDEDEFPDYNRLITTPMDLSLVRESLRVGEYENPLDFQKDMMLIFSNSFQYNTNKKSKVLGMTKSLKAFFLDEFQGVISNWRRVNRRIGFLKKKGTSKSPKSTPIKKTPSKKTRKGRKKEEQYETEGTDDSEEENSRRRKSGKRKLSLDDSFSEEEKPKYKGKGKGKSSLPAKRSRKEPVREEEDNSASDDDVPISKRRENPKLSQQKKGLGRCSLKTKKKESESDEDDDELSEESEEAIEDTPEESSEVDEDVPGFKEDKLFLKNKKRRRSTSDSDPREGNSRGARPKRSAKARVIKDDTESDPEPEAKVPYRRKITTKSSEGPSVSSIQRKSSGNSGSGSRPRRQATEKALSKFESGFSTDDDIISRSKPASTSPKKAVKKSSGSTDPRPQRHAGVKRSLKIQDDTESEEEVMPKYSSTRKKQSVLPPSETVSEDSIQEPVLPIARKSRPPPPQSPIHHNMVSSSNGAQQPGPSSAGVTISAADSSTDPSRSTKRNARTASKFPSSILTEPNSPEDPSQEGTSEQGLIEGGSSSRRPQRKIVKPIRLQDYSDDDELREAKRKNGAPLAEPKPEKKKKTKKKKRRSIDQSEPRQERSERYGSESDNDSESELLSHRLSKSKSRKGGKSQSHTRERERKQSNSEFLLSPKTKRSKPKVNYRDESDSLSEPVAPQPKRSIKGSTGSREDKREKRRVDYRDET